MAIALLAASPQADGLFHRAIGQSGGYALGGRLQTLAEAEKAGVAAAEKLKAPSLKALRNLGGDAIVNGDNTMRPVVDGALLPQQPVRVYAAGKQMKIPVLIGSNADEGTAYPVVMTPAAFEADARKRYGAKMAYVYGTYDVLNRFGATRAWTDADRRYSDAMMGYWLAFARSGDPNAEGLPAWPAYKRDSEQVMLFGQEIKPGALPNKLQLDFLVSRD